MSNPQALASNTNEYEDVDVDIFIQAQNDNNESILENPGNQRRASQVESQANNDNNYSIQQQGNQEQRKQMALDTKAVEDLLKREMMQLSVQARNDIQEEIHGVKCLAPLETPEFLERSLSELDAQLQALVLSSFPGISTDAFLFAKRRGDESYANDIEFKLRFLRSELFNVRMSALRLCDYLTQVRSIFGDVALEREIQLQKDFTKEDLRDVRKGCFQLMPFRDRSGRRICIIFPNEHFERMTIELRKKIVCYLSRAATTDGKETQRNGFVVIVWFNSSYRISYDTPLRRVPLQNCWSWGCARASAIHICTPDTPYFRFRRSIMVMQANQRQRSRVKFHVGEPVELRYALQSYGIPTENIPMTWSGTIKDAYLKNWIKLRKAIENDREAIRRQRHQFPRIGFQPYKSAMSNVVECPNMNDVAFRQGTSLHCHPGNVRFRSLVESFVIKLRGSSAIDISADQSSRNNDDDTTNLLTVPISILVAEIINQIIHKDKGRVLVWTPNHNNQKYGCWCTITKEEQITSKIEYTVREYIRGGGTAGGGGTASSQEVTVSRTENRKSNLQTSESSTSIFRLEGGETPLQSLSAAAGNLLPGTAASVAAPSMSNKRAKMASSSSAIDNSMINDDFSSSDDEKCQLFCRR
eukprot:CAMPEP_0116131742 /NCGR_PEP_ID=MMETSP0329-20121206/9172_1 /TAXON_ID=697910 /ORGANISM="Pseudo-nitzschia arenysensis, Strain B593" /LENGTH=641 /DNA_ID=CAMNT_0003626201 /DNA_START=74 /DNA_END=1999 /DNA_ORIENTATION=+